LQSHPEQNPITTKPFWSLTGQITFELAGLGWGYFKGYGTTMVRISFSLGRPTYFAAML